MAERYKVTYTVKQADNGGLLTDYSKKFETFSEAIKYIRAVRSGPMASQMVGNPLLESAQ